MDLQLLMQSVPITTKVVSTNPVHGEVCLIQHYVINLSVTCGRSVIFSGYSCTNKTDRHDITDILLKMALKHNKPKSNIYFFFCTSKYSSAPLLPPKATPLIGPDFRTTKIVKC